MLQQNSETIEKSTFHKINQELKLMHLIYLNYKTTRQSCYE